MLNRSTPSSPFRLDKGTATHDSTQQQRGGLTSRPCLLTHNDAMKGSAPLHPSLSTCHLLDNLLVESSLPFNSPIHANPCLPFNATQPDFRGANLRTEEVQPFFVFAFRSDARQPGGLLFLPAFRPSSSLCNTMRGQPLFPHYHTTIFSPALRKYNTNAIEELGTVQVSLTRGQN